MSDNQRITYIDELQIINTTLQEVKSNLSSNQTKFNHLDDLFHILHSQLSFINQIMQTYQALNDDLAVKNEIISNLTRLNKENTEKLIEDFIQKVNQAPVVIKAKETKTHHKNGSFDKKTIYPYYQPENKHTKMTVYSNTHANGNGNGQTHTNTTVNSSSTANNNIGKNKGYAQKRKESAPKINNDTLKRGNASGNTSINNSTRTSNAHSNQKAIAAIIKPRQSKYIPKFQYKDKEKSVKNEQHKDREKEEEIAQIENAITLPESMINQDIIQRIKNKTEIQRKGNHIHANSLTLSHSQVSLNKDIIISTIKLPKITNNDDLLDNTTIKQINKSSSAVDIIKKDNNDRLQSNQCDQSLNQISPVNKIQSPPNNPNNQVFFPANLSTSTLLGISHYSINQDDLV